MDYSVGLTVLIFITVLLTMLAVILLLSWAIRPLKQRPKAQETYECGYPAEGDPRAIGFLYMSYAALFLVFDIAALYLFLYARIEQPSVVSTVGFLFGLLTLSIMILYGTRKRRYYVA